MSTPRGGTQTFRGRGTTRGTRYTTTTTRGGRVRNSKSPNPPNSDNATHDTSTGGFRGSGRGRARATTFTGSTRGAARGSFRGASTTFARGGQQSRGRGASAFRGRPTNVWTKMEDESWRLPENAGAPDYKHKMEKKFRELQERRLQEVDQAVAEGKMAAEGAQMDLKNAIAKVGTCEDMCPEFERAERIFQNMVHPCEMIRLDNGKKVPCEDRMVLSYKKSAAGRGEVPPSDILSVAAVKRTIDYLLDDLVGGEDGFTPDVHGFIWDRTRELRKTLRIQAHGTPESIRIIIECFELIVRFHIFSLHHWSDPDNAKLYPGWESFQEFEQLRNSMTELSNLYSDHATVVQSPNEAEFRAYEIIMAVRHEKARIEGACHSWRENVINDKRVQLALKIYAAAGSLLDLLGPARLGSAVSKSIASSPAIAQGNSTEFWDLLKEKRTPFLMACAAELTFVHARRTALVNLQKAYNRPKVGAGEDLIMSDVTKMLGFDTEDEAMDFCEDQGFEIGERADGNAFLKLNNSPIDVYAIGGTIHFSRSIVDVKRRGRMPLALIRNLLYSDAIAQGLVDHSQSRPGKETGAHTSAPATQTTTISGPFAKPNASSTDTSSSETFAKPSEASTANPFMKPSAASPSLFAPGNPFAQPAGTNAQPALSNTDIANRIFNTPSIAPLSGQSAWQPSLNRPALGVSDSNPFAVPSTNPLPSFHPDTSKPLREPPASNPFAKPTSGDAATSKQSISPFSPQTSQQATSTSQPVPAQSTVTAQNPFFVSPSAKTARDDGESLFIPDNTQPAPEPVAKPTTSWFPSTTTTQIPQSSQSNQPKSSPTPSIFDTKSPSDSQVSKKPLFTPFPPPAVATTSTTAPTTNTSLSTQKPLPIDGIATEVAQQPLFAPATSAIPKSLGQMSSNAFPQPSVSSLSTSGPTLTGTAPSLLETAQARPIEPVGPPPTPPPPPGPTRQEVLAQLTHAVLDGPEGLIQQFLEHEVGNVVRRCVAKVEREHERDKIAEARRHLLARKYARRWKDAVWKRSLLRRAKKRRAEFAQSMRELALTSRQNSRAGSASSSPTTHFEPFTSLTGPSAAANMLPPPKPNQSKNSHRTSLPADSKLRQSHSKAGPKNNMKDRNAKRKSAQDYTQSTTNGRNDSNGAAQRPSKRPRAATYNVASEMLLDTERLMRQASRLVSGRTDTTRSDYFKLKALGIDPDTPFVPKTKPRKRSYDDDDDDMLARKSRVSPAKGISAINSPYLNAQTTRPATSKSSDRKAEKDHADPASKDSDDDELFAKLAAVKKQMADDTAWFREIRSQSERSSVDRANGTEKQRKAREWKPSINRTEARWQREGLPSFLRAPWTPRETVSRSASRLSDTQQTQKQAVDHTETITAEVYDYEDGDAEEGNEVDQMNGTDSGYPDDEEYEEEDVDEDEDEDEEEYEEEYDDDGIDTQAFNMNSAFAAKGASVDDAIEL